MYHRRLSHMVAMLDRLRWAWRGSFGRSRSTALWNIPAGSFSRPYSSSFASCKRSGRCGSRPVGRPNSKHGQPLGYASCSPPIRPGYLTLGTPDVNGKAANGNGSLTIRAIAGNASTPADEADVRLGELITDVRRKSDLADYTGQLQTTLTLRITDRNNADAPSRSAATTIDLPFSFTTSCTATSQTDRGSTCTLSTTADTLLPGAVPEGKRSIWDVRKLQVYDGGSDGRAATLNGNSIFESQGLFIP